MSKHLHNYQDSRKPKEVTVVYLFRQNSFTHFSKKLPGEQVALRGFHRYIGLHLQGLRCRIIMASQVVNIIVVVNSTILHRVVPHAFLVLGQGEDLTFVGNGLNVVFVRVGRLEETALEVRKIEMSTYRIYAKIVNLDSSELLMDHPTLLDQGVYSFSKIYLAEL